MHPPITPSGASACPSLGRRLPRCVATLIVPAALLAIVALPAVASAKGRSADSDGDHLSDRYERRVSHTNPRRADTDRDGLRDRYEIRRSKTNPRRRDTDKDGLSDRYEWRRSHTNPRRRDTDKDGLSDRYEWRRSHTNPRRRDTDKDGLSDRQELFPVGYLAPGKPAQSVRAFAIKTPRTDPRRRDTDGDGLTDGYEVRRSFTNPIMRDTDGDGLTDGQEVLTTHTNPLSRDTDGDGISDYAAVRPGSGAASTTPRPATTPPVASTPPVAATSGACASQTSNGVDGRDPWGGCFPGALEHRGSCGDGVDGVQRPEHGHCCEHRDRREEHRLHPRQRRRRGDPQLQDRLPQRQRRHGRRRRVLRHAAADRGLHDHLRRHAGLARSGRGADHCPPV